MGQSTGTYSIATPTLQDAKDEKQRMVTFRLWYGIACGLWLPCVPADAISLGGSLSLRVIAKVEEANRSYGPARFCTMRASKSSSERFFAIAEAFTTACELKGCKLIRLEDRGPLELLALFFTIFVSSLARASQHICPTGLE